MSNYYENLADTRFGQTLLKSLGLPMPVPLLRGDSGDRTDGCALVSLSGRPGTVESILKSLGASGLEVCLPAHPESRTDVSAMAREHALTIRQLSSDEEDANQRFSALLFDATDLQRVQELEQLHRFFHPVMRNIAQSGRIIILGRPPEIVSGAEGAAVCQALEGFCRSIAKEIGKRGATANLVQVAEGAEDSMAPALRFLLSPRSAYVDGQVIRVSAAAKLTIPEDPLKPLCGQTALVTGASRGIGEAIARTLHRRGAHVIGVDVASAQAGLDKLATEINGIALIADITSAEAPGQLLAALQTAGGANIVVHNAGITRDKMLANMPEDWWTSTLDVNLGAVLRINQALLDADAIAENGRIIGVSSMNGIAGQVGQSNYAASKAGTIGWVRKLAGDLQDRSITVNAVAPGFIETQMTDAIPLMTREIGRRMNSLSQGGKPIDVAETIAFFAEPDCGGVNGNILRVCGQCVVGA